MTDLYTALTANNNELMGVVLADTDIPAGDGAASLLKSVCEDINTLTFNRITDYFGLTNFQRGTLLRVCSRFLRFKHDNAELLDSVIRSYSINGVSLSFDNLSVKCISGVFIPADIYALLQQTGLTCRVI